MDGLAVDSSTAPHSHCRMIVFDVGAKITNFGLRLLIFKSSTSGVSFDSTNSVVSLSLHVNFSHTKWYICFAIFKTTIYLVLFQVLQLVRSCQCFLVCPIRPCFPDPAFQNSHEYVLFPQLHVIHSVHQTQQNQNYQHQLQKYAYFHSLSSAFWLTFSGPNVNDQELEIDSIKSNTDIMRLFATLITTCHYTLRPRIRIY